GQQNLPTPVAGELDNARAGFDRFPIVTRQQPSPPSTAQRSGDSQNPAVPGRLANTVAHGDHFRRHLLYHQEPEIRAYSRPAMAPTCKAHLRKILRTISGRGKAKCWAIVAADDCPAVTCTLTARPLPLLIGADLSSGRSRSFGGTFQASAIRPQ